MASIFISLGANLGDPVKTIHAAFARLESFSSSSPILKSSLWQTAPVDCPPGSPLFMNAVAGLDALEGETPETLLVKLQYLEKEFGRQPKKVANESRLLDLDIIAFGNETRHLPNLNLPHPRAHLRWFVLQPLCEIAPEYVLPGQSLTVRELLKALPPDDSIRRVE